MKLRQWHIGLSTIILLALTLPVSAGVGKKTPAPEAPPFTGDAWAAVVTYEYGQPRTAQMIIEDKARGATPEQQRELETKLLAVLKDAKATPDAKIWVCRMLRGLGSSACVADVAPLLTDAKLSHMARWAMQGINDPKVDDALLDALGKVSGKLKIGMVSSLGFRGASKAVTEVAKCLADKDVELVGASLTALGQIGTADAAKALTAAKVDDELAFKKGDACIMCADKLAGAGQTAEAAAIYRQVYCDPCVRLRIGALHGIVRTEKEKAVPALTEALNNSKEPLLQAAAGKFLAELPVEACQAMASQLATLPAGAQAVMLPMLAKAGVKSALPTVITLLKSESVAVRLAAIDAAGKLGDESTVPALLSLSTGKSEEATAARSALVSINSPGANKALIAEAQKAKGDVAKALFGVLAARLAVEAMPVVIEAIGGTDNDARGEAIRAAGILAAEQDILLLCKALAKVTGSDRDDLAKAIGLALSRQADAEKRVEPVLAELAAAKGEGKAPLLRVLGYAGGAKALAAVKTALADADAATKEAAVRALSDWPNASAGDDLLAVAKTSDVRKNQILALRGYLRLAALPETDPKLASTMFQSALDVAKDADQKKQVLSGLGDAKSPEALKLVVGCMSDPAVNAEACAAAIKLGHDMGKSHGGEIKAAMKKVVETSKDKNMTKQAEKYLKDGKF